jgi:hypothetical protein
MNNLNKIIRIQANCHTIMFGLKPWLCLIKSQSTGACALLLISTALNIFCIPNVSATSINENIDWKPQSTEKLVKLPPTYLKKSIDSDFFDSNLGKALEQNKSASRLKIQSLSDLKDAINHTEDPKIQTELRHQLLAEKQSYIKIISEKNKLRRKQTGIKQRLFENMLSSLTLKNSISHSHKTLIDDTKALPTDLIQP